MIDEDALLVNDKVEIITGDCSTRTKACKNCTCGKLEFYFFILL